MTRPRPPHLAEPAARCTERSCGWRWRAGEDRPCPLHLSEHVVSRQPTLLEAAGHAEDQPDDRPWPWQPTP